MNYDYDVIDVKLIAHSDASHSATLHVYEESPQNKELTQIDFFFDGKKKSMLADSLFEALVALRLDLEPKGIQIMCNGTSLDVYPSPMQLSMGPGRKACRLQMGHPVTSAASSVDIFECGGEWIGSSVEEQVAHYKLWRESLALFPRK